MIKSTNTILKTTTTSQTYEKDCIPIKHYYTTRQLTVSMDSYYTFTADTGSLRPYLNIYENHFNPLDPNKNVISIKHHCLSYHFYKLMVYLRANNTYILLVTSLDPSITGTLTPGLRFDLFFL